MYAQSRGIAWGHPVNPGPVTSILMGYSQKAEGVNIGRGNCAEEETIEIGNDEYKKVRVGGELLWDKDAGFMWNEDIKTLKEELMHQIDFLKRAVVAQQHHINALNQALKQEFDGKPLPLPEDVEEFLESTRQ